MVRSSHIKHNRLVSSGSTRGAFVFSEPPPSSQDGKETKELHHLHFRRHHHHNHHEKIQIPKEQNPHHHPATHVDLNDMNVEQLQLKSHGQKMASHYPSSFKPSRNNNNNGIHHAVEEDETIGRNRRLEFAQLKQPTEKLREPSNQSPRTAYAATDARASSSLMGEQHLQSNLLSHGDQKELSQQRSEIAAFSSQAIQQLPPHQYGTLPPAQQRQPQLHQVHPLLQQQQPQQEHPLKQKKIESHGQKSQAIPSDSFEHNPSDHRTCKEFIVDGCLWLWHTTVFDKDNPEFSSMHQFTWAVILGTIMGFLTAFWGIFIDYCVELVWVKTPALLLHWGIFTDLDGYFPLPHYMWICPSIFGGVLSYLSAVLPPIPDQNMWIETLHRVGIVEHDTFIQLILISTAGMASGLSLGPELPLVISAGMIGSYIGKRTRQSILSARVMNLTAASAAIGGFFGFPMAGALFVLELPHRMGLQYFEALSPATIASIIAVLVNRIITKDDVKGMFTYPFLSATLPSSIFGISLIYGLAGTLAGTIYTLSVLKLKGWVHDWFHYHHDHGDHEHHHHHHSKQKKSASAAKGIGGESLPLIGNAHAKIIVPAQSNAYSWNAIKRRLMIKQEPKRAACAGALAGALVGLCCMFFPHLLFWGEAQLQTLIDTGKTPLPFLQEDDLPTTNITAYGYCMIDPKDEISISHGFGIECAFILFVGKILVIGLSLGTGIIGGQFWGPLFVGCIFAQFFSGIVSHLPHNIENVEFQYPCVAILCIMGATHVVTFRAHMAIMLILTLTISSFAPSQKLGVTLGGDYAAIFPLLVVSCFVSLMLTRTIVFYKKQCSRGDIIASPEVLCEPRKEGTPGFPVHHDAFSYSDQSYSSSFSDSRQDDESSSDDSFYDNNTKLKGQISQADIEERFSQQQKQISLMNTYISESNYSSSDHETKAAVTTTSTQESTKPKDRLDELLSKPMDAKLPSPKSRRRTKSDLPDLKFLRPGTTPQPPRRHVRHSSITSKESYVPITQSLRERIPSSDSSRLSKVSSYGEIREYQPDLMSQGRQRASSVHKSPMTKNKTRPPRGRHSRGNSRGSSAVPDLENDFSSSSIHELFSSSES